MCAQHSHRRRLVTWRQLAHWITVLAEMDQALKRSKRPDYLVFEAGLLALSA